MATKKSKKEKDSVVEVIESKVPEKMKENEPPSSGECGSVPVEDNTGTLVNTKTISIYEALNERKILRDRISKLTNGNLECTFVYDPKSNSIYKGASMEKSEIEKISISRIDKLEGLLNRYSLLSQLIDHSNATTPITICGKQYLSKSAAMAVYGVIDKEIAIYEGIKSRIINNVTIVSNYSINNLSEDRIADYISRLNLATDTKSETIDEIRASYIKQNTLELIDPKNMRVKVDEILEELLEFKDRFNTEINKSNLQTFIDVPVD